MQLPSSLRRAIDEHLAACEPAQLRAASARLSSSYRQGTARAFAAGAFTDDHQRAAYLAVRMPATFAAVVAALGWTRQAYVEQRCENTGEARAAAEIRTLLDLGSGPGTALWAAAQVFPTLTSATAIERDPRLIEIARRLTPAAGASEGGPHPPSFGECGSRSERTHPSEPAFLRNTHWLQGDLTAALPEGAWDLVVCSYTLNELGESQRAEFLRRAWARTAKLLVVIEPGTPAGFANILAARTRLLEAADATLVAPCPNALTCPMANGGDWCHFAARVERTASHRRLKEATLGHEDEKFSYIAFARRASATGAASVAAYPPASATAEASLPQARILRHPRIFNGYTQLTLCRDGEIASTTVTRSQKENWRRLKRLGWGDPW